MDSTNRTFLFLCLCFLLLSRYEARRVDCRKHVFAPICRGAAAKRDIQKLEPLFEEPRTPRYMPNDDKLLQIFNTRSSDDNEIYDKTLLDTLLKKMSPKNADYDSGTGNC